MSGGVEPLVVGRYALFDALASGGMATVHLGRLLGPAGVARTVAVKRLHKQYTTDPDFVTMFMDEARIVARIRHPNVVPMVDVIESREGLFLIMEYIHGESFSKLLRTCRAASQAVPIPIAAAILHGVLLGLHAAHETRDATGERIDVVHRDVSPQNIIIGSDGVARVLDFGVAKAAGRAQVTRQGQIKGKLAYMSPEQIRGSVDRRSDVFAASIVLWEALAGRRIHDGAKEIDIVARVMNGSFERPSQIRGDVPPALDAVVMRGLEHEPERRYSTAREMALDLERRVGIAPPAAVAEWVARLAHEILKVRADAVASMERASALLEPSAFVAQAPALGASASGVMALPTSEARIPIHPNGTRIITMHSTSPMDAESGAAREPSRALAVFVSFCAGLAVIGAVLGGYALYLRGSGMTSRQSSAPPRAVALPSAASEVPPATTPPASAPAPSAATSASACDPPYVVDGSGRRRRKPECPSGQ